MPVVLLFSFLLLLTGCRDETTTAGSKQAEVEARQKAELIARQQTEQAQRLANERQDRQDQLHTLRIVAFVLLAGAAVAAVAWSGRPMPRPVFDNTPGPSLPLHGLGLGAAQVPSRSSGRIIDLPLASPSGAPFDPAFRPTSRRRRRRAYQSGNQRDSPYHHPPHDLRP